MSCSDLPQFQFVYSQLQLLLTHPEGRRLDRNIYVLAAELHNISLAAYKMLRKSGSVVLPGVELLKNFSPVVYIKNWSNFFKKLNLSSVLSTFF